MTKYDPQHITVIVRGPVQGAGGPADTTWEVVAHYTQPGTGNQRDIFKFIYLDEQDARAFAATLTASLAVQSLLFVEVL